MRPILASLGFVLLLPTVASAEGLSVIVGVFNIFVGILLALSLIIYVGGMIVWVIRLGAWPSYRDEAIGILKWPVAILFVVAILLAIANLVQTHLRQATFVLGVIIVIAVAWFIINTAAQGTAHKEKEEH